jgi:hypothetical protein
MPVEKILIAVKTYPALSLKHQETVCTAGFRQDGSWIRIYPVPFRLLGTDKHYSKFQWVTLPLERNLKDPRPESYKVTDPAAIVLGEVLGPERRKERDAFVLKSVYTNKKTLLEGAKTDQLSLATFRPSKFVKFEVEKAPREWDAEKLAAIQDLRKQGDLFKGHNTDSFEIVEKIPYKFSYTFLDDEGISSTLMIEDWEIGQLYRNCLKRAEGDEAKAVAGVIQKYWDTFMATRDVVLILGTTFEHHVRRHTNPFVIVGVYAPLADSQLDLL